MLLLGRSIKDVLIATDMVIFLLQHLGFVINLIKSILTPSQKNRVFRSASGFSQHLIVFDSRETDESDQPTFGDIQDRESVYFTTDKSS